MQSQAPPRRKSSAGIVLVILFLFVAFIVGGLLLAGVGAVIFARAEAQQAHAVAQRERAMAEAQRLRAEMESHRDQLEQQRQRIVNPSHAAGHEHAIAEQIAQDHSMKPENEPIRVANRELTLQVDAEGNIEVDGKEIKRDQLKQYLRDASKGRETALTVTVKADKKCLFGHVASVLSICQELDVANVRVATLD